MKFIPFNFKYKYRISILIFIVVSIIVGLLWGDYSNTILLNLLIPMVTLLLTLYITMITEKQNGGFEYIHNRFRVCNQLSYHGNKHSPKYRQDDIENLYKIINEYLIEHINDIERLSRGQLKWKRYFFGNIPRKTEIIINKMSIEFEKHMPQRLKDECIKRSTENLSVSGLHSMLLGNKNIADSIVKFLKDNGCQMRPNEHDMNYFPDYFSVPDINREKEERIEEINKENQIKLSEIQTFVEKSRIKQLVKKYKKILWDYYIVTVRNVTWYHKLYSHQFSLLVRSNQDFDEMTTNINQAVSDIQDTILEQTYEIERAVEGLLETTEDTIINAVDRAKDDILETIDEYKKE